MGKRSSENSMNAIKYKSKIIWGFVGFIFFLTTLLSFFYVTYIKNFTYRSIYNNVSELSEQTATQLNLFITNQQQFLKIMVDLIESNFFENEQDIFKHFESELENYYFTRFVILDENGNGITSDGYEVKSYPNVEEFFGQDDIYLSENRPSTVSDNQVNIYSKTFYFQNQKKVLFATINSENYKEILLRRLFNGKGATYLINAEGSVLIDSVGAINKTGVNLYHFLEENYQLKNVGKLNQMQSNIKNGVVGTFDIRLNKNIYFIHYEKVNVNNWYVVTIASDDIIAQELPLFLSVSLGLCFLIIIVVIVGFIYIYVLKERQNQKLYHIAYQDSLTGLGNEAYFKEKGTELLMGESKNRYAISLDINKFKALNNIYGYEFCNEILKEMSKQIAQLLPSDAIMCRISNDIFAILTTYHKNIKYLLDDIYLTASELTIKEEPIHINLSIGAYKVKSNEYDINRILDKANIARSKMKGIYGDHYYIFDEELELVLIEEQQIETSMESALKNEEFKIIYQPKIYTKDESLAGAEALVRWYHKDSIISPSKFIPLFEKNHFILKLDLYVFEQVCKDIALWKEQYRDVPVISVNVSKVHFSDENFIDEYVKIADKYHIEKSKIDLEITESATMNQEIDIIKVLNKIKEKGFLISIDDFGTGYSSLSMLQSLPIDILKIDKAFIDEADLNNDRNIIDYIVLISKHLGVRTIVEGIETKEQADFIKRLECDIIQGYYYSKPISKDEFETYLNKMDESD